LKDTFFVAPLLASGVMPVSLLREVDVPKDEDDFPAKFVAGVLRQLVPLVGEVTSFC
jgi:hypothetical protein